MNDTPEPRTVKLALKGADGAKFSLYQLDDDHDGFAGVPCDPSKPLALAPFMTALLTTDAADGESRTGQQSLRGTG